MAENFKLVKELLRFNGWEIDYLLANKLLLSHPGFPSLEAYTETLEFFSIPYEAFITDYETLCKIDAPLMVHLKKNGGSFALVGPANEKEITVSFPETGKRIVTAKKYFLSQWSGIVLTVNRAPSKINKKRGITVMPYLFSGIALSLALLFSFLFSESALIPVALLINLTGALVSYIIVQHESESTEAIFNKICHIHTQTDCKAVLSSPASRIYGISVGEIGLVYFTYCSCILILLPFVSVPSQYINVLFGLSLCTLPYTLFSLVYQKFTIGKWCPFCLITLLVLWCTAGCYFLILDTFTIRPFSRCLPILALLCISLIWWKFRSFSSVLKKNTRAETGWMKMKRDPDIFSLLAGRQPLNPSRENGNEIRIGDPDHSIRITTVVSENCIHCKNLLKELLRITESRSYPCSWTIRFIGRGGYSGKDRFSPLLYYLYYNRKVHLIPALKDWVHGMKYRKWISKYALSGISLPEIDADEKIEDSVKISVPIIYLNNRKLPAGYEVTDLEFILMDKNILSAIMS